MRRRRWHGWVEQGSATVEFAMVLPAFALVLGLMGVAAQHGVAMVRVQDAASAAARVALVDTDTQAREVALGIAGGSASVSVDRDGEWIRVTVTESGPWGLVAQGTAVTHAQE